MSTGSRDSRSALRPGRGANTASYRSEALAGGPSTGLGSEHRDPPLTALFALHQRLLDRYGPLHWWPAETPFEVVVGAVLTQNTAWANVEKAIENLKAAGVLDPASLRRLPLETLEQLIRPSGTYSVKARRLKALLDWLGDDWRARLQGDLEQVRVGLLQVPGVGPETADAILLYAAGRPSFVVDAYTRRILSRLGLALQPPGYEAIRRFFMDRLPHDAPLFNEVHAQFVQLGKDYCRKAPRCGACPLLEMCPTGRGLAVPHHAIIPSPP